MKDLKIKVCGMRDPENIQGVLSAEPDYLGYIFYSKSKRYVGKNPAPEIFEIVPKSTRKVGVFVNEPLDNMITACRDFNLEVAQLHGSEDPDYCSLVRSTGLTVFKAFSVGEEFDFSLLETYREVVDFFLFDTKGKLPGGTGLKFDWDILQNYHLPIPFLLSGGIKPEDIEALREFNHEQLYALDINSGFEISPALKAVDNVRTFIQKIRK